MNTSETRPDAYEENKNERNTGRIVRAFAKAALPFIAVSSVYAVSACGGDQELPASPNTILVDRSLWDMPGEVCPDMNPNVWIDWVQVHNGLGDLDEIPRDTRINVPVCKLLPADD